MKTIKTYRKTKKSAVLAWMARDEESAFKYHIRNAGQLYGSGSREGIGFPFTDDEGTYWPMEESFRLFKKYAEQGDAVAQWGLGCFYYYGKCVERDLDEAAEWFKKSVMQGDSWSAFMLAKTFEEISVDRPGYDEAMFLMYKAAAEQGIGEAQEKLGLMYLVGKERNLEESFKWYKAAANQYREGAMNVAAYMYYLGKGVEKNNEEAYRLYSRLEEKGIYPEEFGIDTMYENGDVPPCHYKYDIKKYKKDENNFHACYRLGLMYHNGWGAKPNDARALTWYGKSIALHECPEFMMEVLADMYYNGEGMSQSYVKAIKWYKRAADKGLFSSQEKLIELWYGDDPVKPDFKTVYKWLGYFANGGLARYQYKLGILYLEGKCVKQDLQLAIHWLKEAAKQGYTLAQEELVKLGE